MNDLFRNLGVEIELKEQDDFLKIKETLTRIGIASKKDKILYQSCHILHKRGRYSILHFKELFILDGKEDTISDEDISRRNTVAKLLEEWNLCKRVFKASDEEEYAPLNKIKILSHKEKEGWILQPKYNVGKK